MKKLPSPTVCLALLAALLVLAACGGGRDARPETISRAPDAPVVEAMADDPVEEPTVDAGLSRTEPSATPTPQPTAPATQTPAPTATPTRIPTITPTATPTPLNRLSIAYLRREAYPGSDIIVEQTLAPGANYDRFIASYLSEGLKQYALLTVPRGQRPTTGWPVVIFNHGYIPPSQYRTTERYVAYVDSFARAGYIVFRPDYRGHGNSEGSPSGAYGSPAYVIDVLNAVSSIKRYPAADPGRLGMWGHSMGGWITLRAMVVSPDIRAGVIWGGVVGAYEDLFSSWRRGDRPVTAAPVPGVLRSGWRGSLSALFGPSENNPDAWRQLSANYFLEDLSGPIQLHHARGDASVPVEFSEILYEQGLAAGMPIELVTYPGDNHNISGNFNRAMASSVAFFDRWLKQPLDFAAVWEPTVFTGSTGANLRGGPGTNFAVVGALAPGDSLPVVGRNPDRSWWQVQTADGVAWVAASVTLALRTADVPVIASSG